MVACNPCEDAGEPYGALGPVEMIAVVAIRGRRRVARRIADSARFVSVGDNPLSSAQKMVIFKDI